MRKSEVKDERGSSYNKLVDTRSEDRVERRKGRRAADNGRADAPNLRKGRNLLEERKKGNFMETRLYV